MKFAVLLALVGVASCRPSLWDDIEYSYVDAAGRIVKVEYDADDYPGLGWASSVPSLYRAVSTVPAALPYTPTPVSTQYVHVAAPVQAAPAPQVVPRYVYVDDDLDDDAVYMEVSPLVMPRSAAAPVVPSLAAAAAAAPVIPRVAAAPLVTRAAPAAPVVAQQPSPTAVFRAAPVPTLKAAIAGASNIEVVHKYRNSDDDDDDDDSDEK